MFFSFDGIDGAGKSTQIDAFSNWLGELGHEVVICRDPGSTKLGEQLRSILLDATDTPIDSRSEMLVYMAARAQLVAELIRPSLADGKTVVCDRFLLANVVYQGHAGGIELDEVRATGRIATAGIAPDMTVVLDLAPQVALARLNRPFDRMESRGVEFLDKVRSGFLIEAARPEYNATILDATRPPDEIQAHIQDLATQLMSKQPPRAGVRK